MLLLALGLRFWLHAKVLCHPLHIVTALVLLTIASQCNELLRINGLLHHVLLRGVKKDSGRCADVFHSEATWLHTTALWIHSHSTPIDTFLISLYQFRLIEAIDYICRVTFRAVPAWGLEMIGIRCCYHSMCQRVALNLVQEIVITDYTLTAFSEVIIFHLVYMGRNVL